jgi:hypothetical protein
MAVEPFTSIPGSAVANAVDAGRAPLLRAGENVPANLAAVFYDESEGELKSISTEGVGQFN